MSEAERYPILGVFRPTIDESTEVLAGIVDDVVNGGGFSIAGTDLTIRRGAWRNRVDPSPGRGMAEPVPIIDRGE